jgi:hypothetical protein
MEKEKFYKKVAELSMVDIMELQVMSLKEVCENVILPKIARPGGSWNRYSRLSDAYMDLMAEFGSDLYHSLKDEVVNVMFEIGMQRLSKGALLHAPVNLLEGLPDRYKMYSCAGDEPGIYCRSCHNFFKSNLSILFRGLNGKEQAHARKIVFGIMEHVDEDGNSDILWNDELAGVSRLELRQMVEPYATTMCSEKERWEYVMCAKTDAAYRWVKKSCAGITPISQLTKALSPRWRDAKQFFLDYSDVLCWDLMAKYVNFESERYYTGKTKKILRFFGLYEKLTMRKIKQEICLSLSASSVK